MDKFMRYVMILIGYVAIFFVVWNALEYINTTFISRTGYALTTRNIGLPIAAGIIFFLLKHVFNRK